jgi:hypothetical protein
VQQEQHLKREAIRLSIQQRPSIDNGIRHADHSFHEFEPLVENVNEQNHNPQMEFQNNKWQMEQSINIHKSSIAFYE